MLFENLKILLHQGKQYIPDPETVEVPGIFRGRPVISTEKVDVEALKATCPLHAIEADAQGKVTLDLGRCAFCGECARKFPNKITFTKDYHLATSQRENLIIKEGVDQPIEFGPVNPEHKRLFRKSLKLRQVSAGGDNSTEWELGATSNVNFDMGRYGIEFVASPRHADGIVVTGPISKNMAAALQICYDATPAPKVVVLAGVDAISGGVYNVPQAAEPQAAEPQAAADLDRSFLATHHVDLYLPGNPVHPLTTVNGLLALCGRAKNQK